MPAEFIQYLTFRTPAYVTGETPGQEVATYWAYETAVERKSGRLVQTDIHQSSRTTAPFTDEMPEKEALQQLAEIDEKARAKFPLYEAGDKRLCGTGDEYARALPYREHQVYIAGVRQELLKSQATPAKFRLKPGL